MINLSEFKDDFETNIERVKMMAGESQFKVMQVEEKTSQKSGAPMIKLTLHITDINNNQCTCFEYLVFNKKAVWKFSQFCRGVGKEGLYKKDSFDPDEFLGCSGVCRTKYETSPTAGKHYLGVDEYNQKDETKEQIEPSKPVNFDEDVPF